MLIRTGTNSHTTKIERLISHLGSVINGTELSPAPPDSSFARFVSSRHLLTFFSGFSTFSARCLFSRRNKPTPNPILSPYNFFLLSSSPSVVVHAREATHFHIRNLSGLYGNFRFKIHPRTLINKTPRSETHISSFD